MSPDERRAALIDATIPLLYDHGRGVTTRLIAESAGVAEGTIFRVFESKSELVDAAIEKVFEPGRMLADLATIDREAPLRDRALALVTLMQRRYSRVFLLMRAVGIDGPPARSKDQARVLDKTFREMAALLAPDQEQLTMPVDVVAQMLRLLTFSGTHPKFTDGRALSPEQIVDTVLYGAVRRDEEESH